MGAHHPDKGGIMHPSDYPARRHQAMPVDFALLAALLGLPEGMRIVSVKARDEVESVCLTLESADFDEVEHGSEPPIGETKVVVTRDPEGGHFYARWPE